MENNSDNVAPHDTLAVPSTSTTKQKDVRFAEEIDCKQPSNSDQTMDIRGNASTDDLIHLDSGSPTPDPANSTVSATNSEQDLSQSTDPMDENVTPVVKPRQSSLKRKTRNTLKLNLDENTWTVQQEQIKPPATAKLRQNLQAGAARFSAVVQRGKTPEFRFRLVLFFLFSSIIGLVTFTWYLYERHLIQIAFSDKIRFYETQKVIHLLRTDGQEILKVKVGTHIPMELKSFDCELLYPYNAPNMCEEWKYRARLRVTYSHEEVMSCYKIEWESLSTTTTLRDCISLKNAHWYGMGEVKNISWPLSGMFEKPQPFITGDLKRDDFGAILERYWLSSEGVAVLVSSDIPLYISLNDSNNDDLCFEAKYDNFPYYNDQTGLKLEYSICTGADMKSVHKGMLNKFFPSANISLDFLKFPIWATSPKLSTSLTQESIQTYANHIMEQGFPAGFILIDTKWQEREGQLVFNSETFPNPLEIVGTLHIKGFKILLAVNPYICLGASIFKNATEEEYFVSDKKQQVPLLTRWGSDVCAIVDITHNTSEVWFNSRIMDIKTQYGIDGFYFFGGQSSFLPPYYRFHTMTVNPDNFLSLYLKLASETSSYLGVSVGFQSQHISAFVRLAPRTSTWDAYTGLQSIIPSVLTLGLLGYPLVNPGSVGGDVFLSENDTIPDKELYIRWLQLAAFMPVVQLSIPPGDYDLDVIKGAKFMLKIRSERILQPNKNFEYIRKVIDEYHESGAPIIRPMWWLAPKDANAQVINTQFAVGGDLIVAPVLEEGKRSRDIYLPPGRWRDELFGTSRLGGKWIYNYSVPLYKVAYFIKIEE